VDPHGSPARVGRDGALSLRFERRGPRTVLAGCRFTLPLQVLTPLALAGDACVVSKLNPTGAVLGGDRLRVDVHVARGARAVVTTPSATKIHRADGAPAEQDVRLTVEAGGALEWVPDHTIPFAGSAFRQRLSARMAADASLVVVDAFSAGRVARGECWQFRHLESALTIVDDGGWLLHDRFVLAGDRWSGLGYTEGLPYFATIVAIVPGDLDELAGAARAALSETCATRGGVARLPRRGIAVRCLAADAPGLECAVRAVWAAIRTTALGGGAVALRRS
jgi:urease accessory protein